MNADTYGPRNLVGYGPVPPNAAWPNGAKIAIQVVLNYEEGSESTLVNGDPRSEKLASELGPGCQALEGTRNVNIESLYEYGSKAGVWRILRMLKEYGIRCTSYMIGMALLQNPQVGEWLVKDGHEIASHGWRWIDRSSWSEEEEVENIRKTIEAIKDVGGKPPVGWYYGMVQSKAGVRSRALVVKTFAEEGLPLKYYSDDYSDDLPHYVPTPGGQDDKGLLVIPYALDTNDYKDGNHNSFLSPDNFASYLIGAFDELYKEGVDGSPKMMSVGLHARLVGRPGRIAGLRKFFEHAKKHEGVWFATREEIADHWRKQHPYKAQ
ncbi:hypothetical protein CI109_102028 [Kwoniella shandongensis]|uniref:Uncharacterized protein n=1 Tax=Kwoniella shandongensis TaxID=1734106 RepID=A0A5M6BNC9_9TREE|nr:uncharacterized protein CI109_007485 [Kwoniella shandongensis]KAA5524203.1 hypothetical protein CI109_007485 [Kwoniella shandongensis]